ILSGATVALLLQICFIYWFTALLKTDASWRTTGTSVMTVLSHEQFATPLGAKLVQFPVFLQVVTLATWWLEICGPFLLFVPYVNGFWRLCVIAAFCGFHFGLALCMYLGIFPWICIVAWLSLLPSGFWDRICSTAWTGKVAGWVASLEEHPRCARIV